jgi:hypothetical protein
MHAVLRENGKGFCDRKSEMEWESQGYAVVEWEREEAGEVLVVLEVGDSKQREIHPSYWLL